MIEYYYNIKIFRIYQHILLNVKLITLINMYKKHITKYT